MPKTPARDTSVGSPVTIAGVRLTSPKRVLFDELELTKEQLARYYEAVGDWILPELKNRPLSLVRCPQGPGEGCFYQKHIDKAWSEEPDPSVPWREVMAAAGATRDRLADIGLEAFLKTSGGKGLHVAVPLAPRHEWDEVKAFSRAVAEAMAADAPHAFTAKMAKKQRTGRIFIDYLRNGPGATAVAAYSVRARAGAPVSTPLHWDELAGRMKPSSFHAGNVVRRLQGLHSDPWKAFRRTSQTLTAPMKRKLGIPT